MFNINFTGFFVTTRTVNSLPRQQHRLSIAKRLLVVPLTMACIQPAFSVETLNMLRALDNGGVTTTNSLSYADAICLSNENSSGTRDMLVIASFSMETSTGGPTAASISQFELELRTDSGTIGSATKERYLTGSNDQGNGMLSEVFTDVPGPASNDCGTPAGSRFYIKHKRIADGAPVLKTSRITLAAIPLDTTNVDMDWADANLARAGSLTSTFAQVDTSVSTYVDDVTTGYDGERAAYVVATFSTDTNGTDTVGEWRIVGRQVGAGTWDQIGSSVQRSMSAADRPGMAQLVGLVTNLSAGATYEVALQHRRVTGDTGEEIFTEGAHIGIVSLVYTAPPIGNHGYFPWFGDSFTGNDCDYTSANNLLAMWGQADGVPGTNCLTANADPLTDSFALDASADVMIGFTIGAETPSDDSNSAVGKFESQVYTTTINGTNATSQAAVFGKETGGPSVEVDRYFSGAGNKGAMGQIAIWDSTDTGNAQGTFYAYGGWSVNGNSLFSNDATIAGFVGRSVLASKVHIADFKAVNRAGRTLLHWETVAEKGSIGYRVMRLNENTEEWVEVTADQVPGLIDAPHGGRYAVVDSQAQTGHSYTYLIEEQDIEKGLRKYGPFTVTVADGGEQASPADPPPHAAYYRMAKTPMMKASGRDNSARIAAVPKGLKLNETRFRVHVTDHGMQLVTADDLAAMSGLAAKDVRKAIRKGLFRLSRQGDDVAWLPHGKEDGIVFYSEASKTLYSLEDVYLLEVGVATSIRSTGGRRPRAGDTPGVFQDTTRYELNEFSAVGWVLDGSEDFWFWEFLLADIPGYESAELELATPGAAFTGENATLKAYLYGASELMDGNDHALALYADGEQLDSEEWDERGSANVSFEFPQAGNIVDGTSAMALAAELPAGSARSWSFLDAVELSYARRYEAVADELLLRGDGNESVTAVGFNAGDIMVFDVSDPDRPVQQNATTRGVYNTTNSITFVPSAPHTPYFVTTESGFATPSISVRGGAPDLHDTSNAADYIVIAPADLLSAAQRLVDYRATQGLIGMAVDVQHVYDDYNGGVTDASAIEDFLTDAYLNWSGTPMYVTLMGRGTQDQHDNLGLGDNLIPTRWFRTPWSLTPTDAHYADIVEGDGGVWELAVSRLPVVNLAEANAMVDKLIAYEQSAPGQQIVISADNSDDTADFEGFGMALASNVDQMSYDLNEIFLGRPAIGTSHTSDLVAALNQGALLWQWVGHGSEEALAFEPLFQLNQVDELANGAGLPLFASATCEVNQFDMPGSPGLAESMVTHPTSGAIASFAPARRAITGESMILTRAFGDVVMAPGQTRVGDAVMSAMQRYAEDGSMDFLQYAYPLLGDSATIVNK